MSKKYIHMGNDRFYKNRFMPIKNRPMFTKPSGGLWASPVDAEFGWRDWCERENFSKSDMRKSFTFSLSDEARVIHLYSVVDLVSLPDQEPPKGLEDLSLGKCIDFEKMVNDGYDAIELHLSEEKLDGINYLEGLYWKLYGWDCDSILIMNPEVVVEDGK